MSKANRKNVIIVGGGYAGATLARTLSAKLDPARYNLILINPRPYFIHYLATARLTTSATDRLEDTALVPYDKLFIDGKGTFKQGTVASVEAQKNVNGGVVTLTNGEQIEYVALALSPGSAWEGPLGFPEDASQVPAHIQRYRDQFAAAKNIVIVGGGAVGIELAGEIKDEFPSTRVTIVHGGSELFNDAYPHKFRAAAAKKLRKRGIDIVFGEYVDDIPEPGHSAKTRSGKTIAADLVVTARGPKPNTAFLSSLPGALADRGLIRVTPTLSLPSHPSIWALRDVVDLPEQKQAFKAAGHAALVAGNILAHLGIAGGKEKEYAKPKEMIIVTNGRGGGFGYFGMLWGIVVGDWTARTLKAKDVGVSRTRKALGYEA